MLRHFTPAEAEKTLVFVKPITEDLQAIFFETVAIQGAAPQNLQEKLGKLSEKMRYCLEELRLVGCLCVDPERGLVDFPSRRGKEAVLLSWKLGEDGIHFWRDLKNPHLRKKIDAAFNEIDLQKIESIQ